jgi:hypothetical protein
LKTPAVQFLALGLIAMAGTGASEAMATRGTASIREHRGRRGLSGIP